MNVLITGASGFIGYNLAKSLSGGKHRLSLLHRKSENPADVIDSDYHDEVIDWKRIGKLDAVFHLAANNDTQSQDAEEMRSSNCDFTAEVLKRSAERGCKRFIYASSTAVYGNVPSPYREEASLNPLTLYAESKVLTETQCERYADRMSLIGFRFCNVYGLHESHKGHRQSMVSQILDSVADDRSPKLFEFGQQTRDWVYVKDIVKGLRLALNSDLKGHRVYNLASGRGRTFNEIVSIANWCLGKSLPIQYIKCDFVDTYQTCTTCSIEKAERELGFIPEYSLEAGMKDLTSDSLCVASASPRSS